MLVQRIITAIITIPLVTAAIVWGGDLGFLFLVLAFGTLGLSRGNTASTLPGAVYWYRAGRIHFTLRVYRIAGPVVRRQQPLFSHAVWLYRQHSDAVRVSYRACA